MWYVEYQEYFDAIKNYLMNPPILIPPRIGVPFHLYICTTNFALGLMLSPYNEEKKE